MSLQQSQADMHLLLKCSFLSKALLRLRSAGAWAPDLNALYQWDQLTSNENSLVRIVRVLNVKVREGRPWADCIRIDLSDFDHDLSAFRTAYGLLVSHLDPPVRRALHSDFLDHARALRFPSHNSTRIADRIQDVWDRLTVMHNNTAHDEPLNTVLDLRVDMELLKAEAEALLHASIRAHEPANSLAHATWEGDAMSRISPARARMYAI